MNAEQIEKLRHEPDDQQLIEPVPFDFAVTRRSFVQVLGAGIMISVAVPSALAQRRGGRGRGGPPPKVGARIHIGKDGSITVLTGKTEMGQGARAEIAQAAAEELRVPFDRIRLIMADTSVVPNEGNTAGSRTTPSTVPSVREGAVAARELLVRHACQEWNIEPREVEVRDGKILHPATGQSVGYEQLAEKEELLQQFAETVPTGVSLTPVDEWKVLGNSHVSPNRSEMVTGAHKYPSDLVRPGMLYGKILRPPAYGAKLVSIDLGPAREMKDVVVVHDGEFVGIAAPTSHRARQAIEALAATANWAQEPQPSSEQLYDYLRKNSDRMPENPFQNELAQAAKKLKATYHVAYVQHAPMEPRTALAEWSEGQLTVWTGTQNPFGYRGELASAFRLPEESVRVVVPDFGGGFGGKHSGEAAIEAARLARTAGKPVLLRWTREEEFTWAYFRPAGVIDCEASLDGENQISSWHFVNINSGGSAIDTPYRIPRNQCRFVGARAPLRQGSYRALASTANVFAREAFMDELAAEAGVDPLDFRLAHLEPGRLRDVLEEVAKKFSWRERAAKKKPGIGVGIACGTEKGSFVATCAEVEVDRTQNQIHVRHVCVAYECGAIVNPDNLRAQVEGCIVMGLGPAIAEEMRFADGVIENATFRRYRVPHFRDVPSIEIHLLNRSDLPSVGAGETPIIAIAPAIAGAVHHATGLRLRQMPMKLSTSV